MEIRKFQRDKDLERLGDYLRSQYLARGRAVSWLPQRLHDLLYRVGAQETDEGRESSENYIYLWEESGEIAACILPDGENVYFGLKTGMEQRFPEMLAFAEKTCLPLFPKAEDGTVKFWAAVSDSLENARKTLEAQGYQKYPDEEYMSCAELSEAEAMVALPAGFRLLYGEDYPDEENKWTALRLGFHPDWEGMDYRASMNPYRARKQSALYPDSFECLVAEEKPPEKNNVCAYCFVYVDRQSKTALIEPVSTRENYRHRGFGTALLRGALQRCKALGLEKCYVDSFGWRKDFYAAAGFRPEESIGFWYKTIREIQA